MSELEWAEMADPNDPEHQKRYQWLVNHIDTCTTCQWCNEDNSSVLCADAERHFASGPGEAVR